MSLLGSKRGWSSSSEQASSTDAEAFSVNTKASQTSAVKRAKAQECCSTEEAAPSFSFVWQHAVKTPLPGQLQQPLQPADSSTAHTFAGLAGSSCNKSAGGTWHGDVLQQADQMDCESAATAAAGGSSSLVRTSSAPELLKLAQADSAAWQAMHAAAGSGAQQQSALLSHHNYWLT